MAADFEHLEITDNIFKNVKFFISGEVQEKIVQLLKCGGAERLNYFSDYVTHLIVGENPEENDIVDANDVYEIPALTPKWILMCVALKHLVSTKPYLYTTSSKLFTNLIFCFSNVREDRNYLWSLITYNGGIVQLNLNKNCNYLVTTGTEGTKYDKAEKLGSEVIKIVTPDWVLETIKNKSYADFTLFHPKLINWPKPVKHESTTAITGFEPEQSDVIEPTDEKTISDSTQALLDKLKQRMPWNQPSVPNKMETVAPPNVVAPSFIQRHLGQVRLQQQIPTSQSIHQLPASTSPCSQVQSSTQSSVNAQVPRSIVHHTPNSQSQQEHLLQSQQAYNPLNINRLISQSQTRPNVQQHSRGQFAPAQLHQHLLQQRIQQQNIIQRNSSGQIPLQQQLLQQQLSQTQISEPLLQNQLNQGSLMQQQQQKIQGKQTINQLGQHLNQLQHQLQLKQQNQQQPIPVSQQQIQNQQQLNQQSGQMSQPVKQAQQVTQNQQQIQIGQAPVHLHQNQQQIRINQNQQQIQSNQNQQHLQQVQQLQLNQTGQQLNQQQIQVNSNQQVTQSQQGSHNQQQLHLNQNQQQIQLNQTQQQIQLTQSQQQLQQLQLNQNQQLQLNPNQQLNLNQNQSQQVQLNQNQQLNQQQIQLNQNQQQLQLNQNQQQLQINQNQQQIQLSQSQQQLQINQNQQDIQLNQNPVQMNQNPQQIQLVQNQQLQLNQNQLQINQNQQVINQQIIQNTTTNQVAQHQLNQQQIQLGQSQNIQQNISQHILTKHNQQLLQQKQQFINQQGTTGQQQIIQNSPNLMQQQFINSNFNQNQHVVQEQQQLIGQQQSINQQINVQALNQQLSTQNLGQQLNQQQLNQHLNQQTQLGQQLSHPQMQPQQIQNQQITQEQIGQQLNIQLQQQQLNRQQQIQVQQQNQQNLQQQQHQLNQIPQQGTITQQVVRTQFQQQPPKIGQQILVNQAAPQTSQPQRAQIGQQLWTQQSSQVTGQQIIRHPVNVVQQGPRVQWSPNSQPGTGVPQRQYIQLDARTHNELQKMSPEQQAQFVAKLQRHRQLQQRGGHILIRGNVPPGLTAQQQVQWLQQQAKQQGIVLPPNIQQNITAGTLTQTVQHGGAPGLSPINQNPTQFTDQNQQQQVHLRQYRLHQLQLQREQAQKNHLAAQQQQQGATAQPPVVRPIGQPQLADSTTNPPQNPPQVQDGNIQHSLVVNAKTKTALANMLSIKLQSGNSSVGVQRPEALPEPSAAGTLRLMTAQHNAALISKPQEIIALQRRTISGPNGEIIRPPGPPQPPVTPTNDLKIPFTAKSSLPLQHRPGPFYGHNPNLKLPPDLFLLGCIFVVVEIENVLEEEIPDWQQKIEKYGGEVEKQYCSRVTHVLCETQRHGVVMQALRDCKRCVTIVWLSDVIQRKQVLPPWTALHLPNIYLDTSPACKHLISITGFEGVDRQRLKQMIRYTGAKCTSYLSKHNTLLISAKADGRKCSYAKKWQIPIVNVQWLTDIMLGHFTALNQMDHQLYQQYPTPPNFSFDPKLVPNLMVAWKAPINISQESYERVKRSASPVVIPKKTKKPKIETTDENDNISDEQPSNATHKILFSMIANTKEMQKIVNGLGGAVAKDCHDFTHLVMPHLARSNKLFFAIAKGVHIISDQWIRDSQEFGQFLPETNYFLNPKEFNYEYKCDIEQTLQTKNRDKLFEGKFFFVTPSVFPSRRIITELITSSGGVVEKIRRSAAQIEATNTTSPYSYFIITHENDLHLVADLLKNKKEKLNIICNAELIFSAILRQTFEVDPYSVCVL